MKTNLTQLKDKLIELRSRLQKFNASLEENFSSLDTGWRRLDSVWDGRAYAEFVGQWNRSRQSMKSYIEKSKRYEVFLAEKISALEAAESGTLE